VSGDGRMWTAPAAGVPGVSIKEEVRDEQGKVIQLEQRQYYPPDTRAIIFFLKNRMRDKWRNVPEYNVV
jgi:hypothetical protein